MWIVKQKIENKRNLFFKKSFSLPFGWCPGIGLILVFQFIVIFYIPHKSCILLTKGIWFTTTVIQETIFL